MYKYIYIYRYRHTISIADLETTHLLKGINFICTVDLAQRTHTADANPDESGDHWRVKALIPSVAGSAWNYSLLVP